MEITEGTKVQFNLLDGGTLAGIVTRVWGRNIADHNLTIISEDGRTFVRLTSRVTPLVIPCDRCAATNPPAYADRHAATHRRDDRNHADRVAADAALRTGPAATAAEHLGLAESDAADAAEAIRITADPTSRIIYPADVIGQVPDASRAGKLARQMTNWLGSVTEDVPTDTACSDLIEWCRSARDLLADLASWTDAR